MVYSWKSKKIVLSIYNSTLKDSLTSWSACRDYVRSKVPGVSVKLSNWYAHLLYKKLNNKEASIYDFYLQKVLQNKNFISKLKVTPTSTSNNE